MIHLHKQGAAIKKKKKDNEILSFPSAWMELETIMLREVRHAETGAAHAHPYGESEEADAIGVASRKWWPRQGRMT